MYDDPIPDHREIQLHSDHVNETRIINVWTPPAYATGDASYPVLYMPDGGMQEDFPHIANTLAELIEQKRIPPYILVGIENTERGRDLTGSSVVTDDELYCPLSDGAKDFRAFIAEELIPHIDAEYRTTGERALIGESLAGLFVMETLFLSPETFDRYIAFDPSLWWNGHHLVEHADYMLSAVPLAEKKLWFAGSSVEDISEHTRALAKVLEEKYPSADFWTYSDEPGEEHHTIFRATKERAMEWCLN